MILYLGPKLYGYQKMFRLMQQNNQSPLWSVIKRGALARCPKCGQGRLFTGYLKQVEKCSVCGEELGHIRADDGPAWLTIMLVGHIMAPLLLGIAPKTNWPEWVSMAVWPVAALVLAIAILPRAKGMFIGLIWRSGCVGSEK